MQLLIELVPPILALTIIHLFDHYGHIKEVREHRERDRQFGARHFYTIRRASK